MQISYVPKNGAPTQNRTANYGLQNRRYTI